MKKKDTFKFIAVIYALVILWLTFYWWDIFNLSDSWQGFPYIVTMIVIGYVGVGFFMTRESREK